MTDVGLSREVVGVMPPEAWAQRMRLFQALERAHRVRFEARDEGASGGLDAAIVFPPAQPPPQPELPWFAVSGRVTPAGRVSVPQSARTVRFAEDAVVDSRLRGRELAERHALTTRELRPCPGDVVLATCDGSAAWLARRRLRIVSGAPDELEPGESLRNRLRAGRFLEMLPLLQFLRDLEAETDWNQPPLRASLVFDDPNLHSTSYGHLSYPELVDHARERGYHASIASVPLDYGLTWPSAAAIFRQNPAELSLAVHGNNHEKMELLRARDEDTALGLAAQALRRTARLEARWNLSVSRVMCAPHEVCGEAVMRALLRVGFEALALEPLLSYRGGSSGRDEALAGWEPAQFVAGGLPAVPRYPFGTDRDDLVLAAFLNLPLVLYGHHMAVAGGLDGIATIASRVRDLGAASWLSLADIARSNYVSRVLGSTLHVRLYSRLVSISIPPGVEQVLVELPPVSAPAEELEVSCGDVSASLTPRAEEASCAILPVRSAGPALIEVSSAARRDPQDVPPPPARLWPLLRRAATEARDRASPLRRRLLLYSSPSRGRGGGRSPREIEDFVGWEEGGPSRAQTEVSRAAARMRRAVGPAPDTKRQIGP